MGERLALAGDDLMTNPTRPTAPDNTSAVERANDAFQAAVNEYAEEYEYDNGDGYVHTLTEFESDLLFDALAGLFADDKILRALDAWRNAVLARQVDELRAANENQARMMQAHWPLLAVRTSCLDDDRVCMHGVPIGEVQTMTTIRPPVHGYLEMTTPQSDAERLALVQPMPNTPRTDAWLKQQASKRTVSSYQDVIDLAEFARLLERELNRCLASRAVTDEQLKAMVAFQVQKELASQNAQPHSGFDEWYAATKPPASFPDDFKHALHAAFDAGRNAQPRPAMAMNAVRELMTLTTGQITDLHAMLGGEKPDDESEIIIGWINGADWPGLYAWWSEYPEEGATLLGPIADEGHAIPDGPGPIHICGGELREWAQDACNLCGDRMRPAVEMPVLYVRTINGIVEWGEDCVSSDQESLQCNEPGEYAMPLYASVPRPTRPAIPEGYKLVPIEPTREMIRQGIDRKEAPNGGSVRDIWIGMLAAAPEVGK